MHSLLGPGLRPARCCHLLVLLALASFYGSTASAQTTLFSDSFNRTTGLGSGWQVWYGSHTTNGSYAVSGTPPANGNWASVAPYLGTQDYAVLATLSIPTGSSSSGLVARGNPNAFDSDLYSLQLNADGTLKLYRRNAWSWTLLSSVAAGLTANVSYNAELLVQGSNPVHLEGWVGGTKLISYDDGSASQVGNGVPGILNYSANVKYDSFSVTSAPAHLFYDAFTRTTGLGSNWQTDFGSTTTDGAHAVSGTPSTHGNWIHLLPTLSTNDYSVSADVIIPSGALDSGLVARSHTSGAFDSDLYSAQVAVDGHVNLFRRNAYTWTTLSSVAMTVTAGTSYHLMLKVSGTSPVHLEVWVNGVSKVTYDDASASRLGTGVPGIENYNSGVKYSGFAVDSVGSSTPTTSQLTVSLSGSGTGTVTSSPSGINCPTTCTQSVTTGSSVTLVPSAGASSVFVGWGGSCTGSGSCTVEVDSSQTVFANFSSTASSTAYPCGASPCTRGQFPPGTWRPYGATSAFNRKVPANPSVMTGSATFVSYMLGSMSTNKMPGNFVWYTNGISGWPTYYGQASDPTYSVVCDWTPCSASSLKAGHAPAGAVRQGASSPDGHLTYVDQTTGDEWDLFGERTSPLPAAGGSLATTYAGYESISGDGRAVGVGQATDGRVGNLAGRIRAEELKLAIANNSYINHALGITINCVNAVSVYPADPTHLGRACSKIGLNNASAPPMGARMWLNMTDAAIDALAIPTWKKVMLKTLGHYGAIVMDTGSSNYWDWEFESSQQYISMGVTDVFSTLGASLVSGEKDFTYTASSNDSYHAPLYTGMFGSSQDSMNWNTVVWSKLEFLNTCVSDGSCNP